MRYILAALVGLVACTPPSSSPSSVLAPSALSVPTSIDPSEPRRLAPDPVLVDQFTRQLDHAFRKAFRQPGAALMPRPLADLITVPISLRPAGTYTVPSEGPQQVTVEPDMVVATLTINLNLVDKLAVGKSLTLSSYFSTDGVTWLFANGTTWVSYGPGGFTVVDPDGTVRVNPDPRIQVPLSTHIGQFIRVELILPQALDAGATITVQ